VTVYAVLLVSPQSFCQKIFQEMYFYNDVHFIILFVSVPSYFLDIMSMVEKDLLTHYIPKTWTVLLRQSDSSLFFT
jgi:hypothetical protein